MAVIGRAGRRRQFQRANPVARVPGPAKICAAHRVPSLSSPGIASTSSLFSYWKVRCGRWIGVEHPAATGDRKDAGSLCWTETPKANLTTPRRLLCPTESAVAGTSSATMERITSSDPFVDCIAIDETKRGQCNAIERPSPQSCHSNRQLQRTPR